MKLPPFAGKSHFLAEPSSHFSTLISFFNRLQIAGRTSRSISNRSKVSLILNREKNREKIHILGENKKNIA